MPALKPNGPRFNDIEGKRFGRILVVSYEGYIPGTYHHQWACRCDCGKEWTTRGSYLTARNIASCGCLGRENAAKRMSALTKRHGYFGTPEYDAWASAVKRCNPNIKRQSACLALQGIRVCDRFRDFANFIADLGDRPESSMVLGRLDNSLGYHCGKCPDCEQNDWLPNCAWVTRVERQNNRRSTVYITVDGVTRNLAEWSKISGLPAPTIAGRIDLGWTQHDAVNAPIGSLNPSRVFLPKDEVRRRYDARLAVAAAVSRGDLDKPDTCGRCGHDGSVFRIEGHHYLGYAHEHWLDVDWMCRRCHCAEENKVATAPVAT